MWKRLDLTNQRFGKLVAIRFHRMVNGRAEWECNCDCGNTHYVKAGELTRGKTQSCGCLRKQLAAKKLSAIRVNLPEGEAGKRRLLREYKEGAKTRGLRWELEDLECESLFADTCYYCGSEPHQTINRFQYNGIDRVDNDKGYVSGNVVSCCKICNRAKRELPCTEFIDWLQKVVQYRSGSGLKN